MIKVFLVEDEIIIREAIRTMIPWNEYGYEYMGDAADGEVALSTIRRVKPDVVITDIKMPFMDGLLLSRLIKKELPSTKIIILSGHDDFNYAREAISLGVEQYLLKPVNKAQLIGVLEDIQKKYEKENEQYMYYEKFRTEIQEYEKYARRDFFEMLVNGNADITQIYEKAEKLDIDIMAQSYNIVLYSMEINQADKFSEKNTDIQRVIDEFFYIRSEYVLFRNQMFGYAVLVKGDSDEIEKNTEECIVYLESIFRENENGITWFVCSGKQVERLSMLPQCYKEAMRANIYKYREDINVMTYETLKGIDENDGEQFQLNDVNIEVAGPDIIRRFFQSARKEEIEDFVENYIQLAGEQNLKSTVFRQYILLNFYFSTIAFLEKIGFEKDKSEDIHKVISLEKVTTVEEVKNFMKQLLQRGIELRDKKSYSKYRNIIKNVLDFIDENYMDENLTLNTAAKIANVSANHFSALFSQEMKKTFIEYLTEVRMNKAKEALLFTDKRSGEIAFDVGYKDSHYFSYLFKKTQGCTPSEYRRQKGRVDE